MRVLKNFVASFVLFSLLVTLLINVYSGLETNYGVVPNDLVVDDLLGGNATSIITKFDGMLLISGVSGISNGLTSLNPATSSGFDVLGGLTSIGIGALKTVIGLVSTPYEIARIITLHYVGTFPTAILDGLALILVIYVGFIFVSKYLGSET